MLYKFPGIVDICRNARGGRPLNNMEKNNNRDITEMDFEIWKTKFGKGTKIRKTESGNFWLKKFGNRKKFNKIKK